MRVFDTDNQADVDALLEKTPVPEVRPRPLKYRYASPGALEIGLEPVEAAPDVLIPQSEWRERLEEAWEMESLPIHHMYDTWRPKGTRYNQDGLGYCWTWSGTGCMMTTRALESKDTVLLAPVSMGYLVGWANRGNYLASFVNGAREDGICPVPEGETFNMLNRSSSYWSQYDDLRQQYQLAKTWDTNRSDMTRQCISILYYGRSLYIAYNWWGHALELVGIRYNGNTMEWLISNSHNEDDVIVLTGSRAIPDEAIAFVSTRLRGA